MTPGKVAMAMFFYTCLPHCGNHALPSPEFAVLEARRLLLAD